MNRITEERFAMKKNCTRLLALLTAGLVMLTGLAGCAPKAEPAASPAESAAPAEFAPSLDTSAAVELNVTGFFGNFEALDQVVNNFNEYYPNVTVLYEQNSGDKLVEYVKNNPQVDIFMTDDTNLRYADWTDYYVRGSCADLTAAGVDTSAVQDGLLEGCTFDGALLRLPIGLDLTGMVVNKSLLRREGLEVPETWQQLLDVCAALKEKGYTPIQGPESSIYANLAYAMGMATLGSDPALLEKLNAGDEEAAKQLQPAFERIQELVEKGYIDPEVNADYPNDNYDGAILRFFEGDVPFWVCTTEKVGGMKKRESKSEAYSASPFDYEFMDIPLGSEGAYEYVEPWFGFSVNKNSANYDYAVEFLRFLAQEEQLDTIASVKGVPSIAKHSADDRYARLASTEKVQLRFVNNGTLLNHMKDYFRQEVEALGKGETASPEEAARSYIARCAATAAEMAAQ